MRNIANALAKLAIVIGIVGFVLAIITHYSGDIAGVGYWGFTMSAIFSLLLAIALNSIQLTEEE